MAFPIVEGFVSNVGGVDVQAHTANMPAGVVAGEMLILAVSSYYNGSTANDFDTPTGWTQLFQEVNGYISTEVFYKTAAGGETSISLTTIRPTVTSICQCYRVSGSVDIVSAAVALQGASASIDFVTAPTLTPSWSGDTLYLFIGGGGRGNAAFSTLPAGYTTQSDVSGLNSDSRGVSLASGYKTGDGSAESPGDLVLATYNTILANTIALKGVAADTAAPTFVSGPEVSATTDSGHTLSATLDEAGTLYGVRLANGAGAPNSAQVKAGQDSTGSAAPEAKSAVAANSADLVFSTGSASTAYDYYIVAEDDEATPNLQATPTLVVGTTNAVAVPGISALTIQQEGAAVQATDWAINITLVSGGTEVYSGSAIASDASGIIAAIDTTGGSVGDPVRVEGYSDSNNFGFVFTQNLEDNA